MQMSDESQENQDESGVFRAEALDELAGGHVKGDVLRLAPDWINWVYGLLLMAVLTAIGFVVIGRVSEYAAGPAVVRLGGRIDLTATSAGTVVAIEVRAGERVRAGQLLVRFYGAEEQRALARIASELEAQTVKMLSDSGDEGARRELARLQAEKGLEEARLDERSLKAPRAGVVSEVRIRSGQLLQPGDLVLTLLDDATPPSLVVVLPGRFRPQLAPGTPLRFVPDGFKFAYQSLTVDQVGDDVLGPAEVRRFLGPELADAVTIDGPSVIVTAALPDDRFVAEGQAYQYHHGLPGHAWARVRRRSLLLALLPTLQDLLEPRHGG